MAADAKKILRRWEDLKGLRLTRESEWQDIADHFMPRKDFTCTPVPGQLRARRVATQAPQVALYRASALIYAYMVDTSRPFIRPNVSRGLLMAGQNVQLAPEDRDYLENTEWSVFDRMMLPQGGFQASVARQVLEMCCFGTGVLWTGRKRGFGPRYQHRSIRSCWIDENDEGEVDTVYFAFQLAAWRVAEKYPEALNNQDFARLANDEKGAYTMVDVLHAVEPRQGGVVGGFAQRKPFADVTVLPKFGMVVKEGGYNTFPYAVGRLNVEEGSVYGTGLAWQALSDAKVLNILQVAIERVTELKAEPPLVVTSRMFGKPLDRRPGAVNSIDAASMGFASRIEDVIAKLNTTGDLSEAVGLRQELIGAIESAFYVDWIRLRDNGNVTAEEIRERRDLRLKAMSAIVPSVDRDILGRAGDRTLEVMVEEDQLPEPTPALRGIEVDWDFFGPLAMARQQGQAEAILRLIDAANRVHSLDPTAALALDLSEGLRDLAEGWGAPASFLRSREDVEAARQERAAMDQADREAAEARNGAQSLRDAGQGVVNLAQAAQLQQPEMAA